MMAKVYMYISQDKYQLPLAVASSSHELADILGVSQVAISSYICHSKRNKNKPPKFIVVEVEDEE